MSRILVSLGGNALGTDFDELVDTVGVIAEPVVGLLKDGHEVVICHGNGPQVGMIKTDIDLGKAGLHENRVMPLSECVAMSQSYIGYHLQNAIENQMQVQGVTGRSVTTVVSRCLVDPSDPGFADPTKPIGAFFTEEQAAEHIARGKTFVEDSGRGWREVVASPVPLTILEKDSVHELVTAGHVVIAGGGGGIPVIRQDGWTKAIDAVIDKDRTSILLASDTECDSLAILTGVEKVAVDFGKPTQRDLSELTVADAEKYLAEGQFPAGSMGPKIQSAIDFAKSGPGRRCLITSLDKLVEGLRGETGTWVVA
ncbi:carbamate kinase [Austwickia chelonae]|uniref:Carbamate kinase n=1 Tax=Austwickia chelonae NBRC 105200 TaxID=1184607 RepID=K6ULT1_9MICO|nr:carbamate kinase [Austwickia chelonae]GAB77521.1 carbamate kinase [Austwickia chelonae NBRC 105200]SEW12074.1 carbamate kinase [Austwickia chelonae]